MSSDPTSGPYREECGCLYIMKDRPIWDHEKRNRSEPKRVRRNIQRCAEHGADRDSVTLFSFSETQGLEVEILRDMLDDFLKE